MTDRIGCDFSPVFVPSPMISKYGEITTDPMSGLLQRIHGSLYEERTRIRSSSGANREIETRIEWESQYIEH